MKRLLSLLCVLTMITALMVGCGSDKKEKDKNTIKKEDGTLSSGSATNGEGTKDDTSDEKQEPLPKFEGKIKFSDPFSEGLAFVLDYSHQKYFINQKGEIVIALGDTGDLGTCQFVNGWAVIATDGTLCDKKGNIVTPESVGADELFGDALAGGYILAKVTEANYAGAVFKLGVMNFDFEWVVEPTEANYTLLADEDNRLPDLGAFSANLYYKDYLYIDDLKQYLYLKDFTLHDTWEYDDVPETWRWWNKWVYKYTGTTKENDIALDLSDTPNVEYSTSFVGDKAAVLFYNSEANQGYYTLINSKGEFAFDPVKVCDGFVSYIVYDGKYVAVTGERYIYILDDKGNLLGQIEKTSSYLIPAFGDDTVLLDTVYYNLDGTLLF